MKKLMVMLIFLFAGIAAKSQDNDFMRFATQHDSMMVAAYNAKDISSYHKYFDEFLNRYNKLSAGEKEAYKSVLEGAYYNLACTYSLLGDKKQALDNLEKSKFYDYKHMLTDSDLDILRKEPRFIKYMKVAKENQVDFLVTLQKAPKYSTNKNSNLPKFTYQSAKDPHLTALNKAYNLDSVAGRGNDVSQIINLMRWVHNLIPHDGSKGNPDVKNAMDFITICKRDNKTLNCRGLAILLNEVYLAEGFDSRFVTCYPKDTTDQDCHVITIVYSYSLRKWVWMDPTFMAYIMNENGQLLSIEEVRERLINNKPLILNPDADHNHETTQSKKNYLETYMAKNLYKLECPVKSEYNYETYEEGKEIAYIRLVPGDKIPAPLTTKNKQGVAINTTYFTANPKAFWQAPPGQTSEDLEATLTKFKKYYNQRQVDSLCDMASDSWGEHKKTFFTAKQLASLTDKYGEMRSFKYIGCDPDDGTPLFKTVFTKSTHAMGILLDNESKFLNFRFKTSSDYIDGLLAKNK